MNEPRVKILHYIIEPHSSVACSEAMPITHEIENVFGIRVQDGCVHFEMNQHHATVDSARAVVDPYIDSWELDAALTGQPGQFKLRFKGAEFQSIPGEYVVSAGSVNWNVSVSTPTVTISRPFPKPPNGVTLKRDGNVRLMLSRYEDFYDGKYRLPDLAYFCLTVLEGAASEPKGPNRREWKGGRRKKAAEKFGISMDKLNRVGYLSSERGGPNEGRKQVAATEGNELKTEERQYLVDAVKEFIRKVAEDAQSPGINSN